MHLRDTSAEGARDLQTQQESGLGLGLLTIQKALMDICSLQEI